MLELIEVQTLLVLKGSVGLIENQGSLDPFAPAKLLALLNAPQIEHYQMMSVSVHMNVANVVVLRIEVPMQCCFHVQRSSNYNQERVAVILIF